MGQGLPLNVLAIAARRYFRAGFFFLANLAAIMHLLFVENLINQFNNSCHYKPVPYTHETKETH